MQKFMRKYKEKSVGVARLQPIFINQLYILVINDS